MPPSSKTREPGRRLAPAGAAKPVKTTRFRDDLPTRKRAPARNAPLPRDPPRRRPPPREALYDDRPAKKPKNSYTSSARQPYHDDYTPHRRNPTRGTRIPGAAAGVATAGAGASAAATATAAQPKTWRDFAKEGWSALSDVAAVPYFKARDELAHDEGAAKAWLSKTDAGRIAQQQDEDARAAQEERKDKMEAQKDGEVGISKYLSAKRAVEREKERLLEGDSEKYPAIIARRKDEGHAVLVRPKPAGDGWLAEGSAKDKFKMSQHSDRGLGATLLGGAAGASIGDHTTHGLVGSIGGALVGALGGRAVEKFGIRRKEYERDVKERQEGEVEMSDGEDDGYGRRSPLGRGERR